MYHHWLGISSDYFLPETFSYNEVRSFAAVVVFETSAQYLVKYFQSIM